MRLDKFILQKYPNLSRAYIKQQIKLGNVLVGGKKAKPSFALRESDLVGFAPGFEFPTESKIQPNPEIKLNIIFENEDVIVIDKPAGISVHPRQTKTGPIAKEMNNTLVSGLLAYYPPIANVGDFSTPPAPSPFQGEGWGEVNIRPGIVHRLDKDTSGVMIIAKNQRSFDWLKKQFKERKVQKKYIALVVGCPKEDCDTIKTYLTRSAADPSKQKVVPLNTVDHNKKLREAITEYKVIKKFKDYCLIEAYPQTGRLHQIRAQFAWLGNPVAGDAKYGPKKRPLPAGLKRQFLHATELKIILPDGEKKTFLSPLPGELAQIAEGLKKN